MLSDHLKTCDYCRNEYDRRVNSSKPTISVKSASGYSKDKKPTIFVKSAASYSKRKRLSELGVIIKGISYPSLESISVFRTKGASEVAARKGLLKGKSS
jgi:hypothetical protein